MAGEVMSDSPVSRSKATAGRQGTLAVGRRTWALGAGAAAVAAAALPGWLGAAPAMGDRLRIALSQTPHAALLHVAAARGYFAEESLDVTVLPASHGKAAMDLLAQNQADLASAAEVPFVIAVLNGAALAIAASVASVSGELAVVARRDRAIASPRDLPGRKVAVTLGTSGEYFLWAFLIRHKLGPDTVTLVDTPPGRMTQVLADGTVDAVATWQPLVTAARDALGSQAVVFTEANAYTVAHVLVGHQGWLQQHAPAVQRLMRALVKAERFCRAMPAEAAAQVARRLGLPGPVLEQAWAELRKEVDLRQSLLITLEDEARWAMARGYAPLRPLPNFLSHLSLEALLAVQPGRVTVVH
jgi:ABC-type nitrate/sulfonate/bicarbonate transport system substrate-binding protein